MAGAKNVIIRTPNPGLGQGDAQAISARTGWKYEHDETDAQIDAIEDLIATHRSDPEHATATFSWVCVDDDGNAEKRMPGDTNVRVTAVTYHPDNPDGQRFEEYVWLIGPDGNAVEE